MSRIRAPDPENAPEKSQAMLKEVHKMLGMTPNLFRVMGNSKDPERIALGYTEDCRWRNRAEFFKGRGGDQGFFTP